MRRQCCWLEKRNNYKLQSLRSLAPVICFLKLELFQKMMWGDRRRPGGETFGTLSYEKKLQSGMVRIIVSKGLIVDGEFNGNFS